MFRRRSICGVLVSSAVLVACSDENGRAKVAEPIGATASIEFTAVGRAFAGDSILVCGERDIPADGRYPCASSISVHQASSGSGERSTCSCFDVDEDGNLLDRGTGRAAVIDNLCPSDDPPASNWTFTYSVFSSTACSGTQLNDGMRNLACYDTGDLVSKKHPNGSVEPLRAGRNVSEIVCVTKNASKEWHFASCADTSTTDDITSGRARYDCGCYATDDPVTIPGSTPTSTCTCPSGPSMAPPGCQVLQPSCEIVCGGTSS